MQPAPAVGAANVARVALAVLGVGLLANAGWLALTRNLNLGMGFTAALGAFFVAWGALLPKLPRWLTVTAVAGLATVLGMALCLAAVGSRDTATYDEDAAIVLGAAVHGSVPSNTLIGRLDKALEYHARNPKALIVVTGGLGHQEHLAESHVMRDYLLNHGLPPELILIEGRATSTAENFRYSKALLDARLAAGYRVAFITDEFHVYRSSLNAARIGMPVTHVHSHTSWFFWATTYLREEAAVLATWVAP